MMYNFRNLINMYSSPSLYIMVKSEGYRDEYGRWTESTEELVKIVGAVTPLSADDLVYGDGGTYNADDRKLYCYENLEKGTQILHKGNIYTIQNDLDYSEHDKDLHIFYMRRGDRE